MLHSSRRLEVFPFYTISQSSSKTSLPCLQWRSPELAARYRSCFFVLVHNLFFLKAGHRLRNDCNSLCRDKTLCCFAQLSSFVVTTGRTNNYRSRKKKRGIVFHESEGETTLSLLHRCNYVLNSCEHVKKKNNKLSGYQTIGFNC